MATAEQAGANDACPLCGAKPYSPPRHLPQCTERDNIWSWDHPRYDKL